MRIPNEYTSTDLLKDLNLREIMCPQYKADKKMEAITIQKLRIAALS
jgi:hypothetical protein